MARFNKTNFILDSFICILCRGEEQTEDISVHISREGGGAVIVKEVF